MRKNHRSKKLLICTVAALISATAIGFLLHFTYELCGENHLVALIAPVNESIWEHLKLLTMPFLFTAAIEYLVYGMHTHNFFSAKLFGITASLFFVVSSYYTLAGAFGLNTMATNVGIFIFGTFIAYIIPYRLLQNKNFGGGVWEALSVVCLASLVLSFFIFTYKQPQIPLFRDPMTMSYGIE